MFWRTDWQFRLGRFLIRFLIFYEGNIVDDYPEKDIKLNTTDNHYAVYYVVLLLQQKFII